MSKNVIVIGGGAAGIEAAGQLAMAGYPVIIIEKGQEIGGHLLDWYHLFPDRRNSVEVVSYLNDIAENRNISILKNRQTEKIERNKGNFHLRTSAGDEIEAGAIVVATGFDLFRSEKKEEYGYGIYDNVITSADLEKMFRAGDILLKNGKAPSKIGLVHCVGSRDEKSGNLYCSKLCCVTAVKQAIELREKLPSSKVFCFYMDMRMGGAHYEELYLEAQEKHAVSFIRGKVSEVGVAHNGSLVIKAEDTLAGRPIRIELDMLVLMAGMEMSEGGRKISSDLHLSTGSNRFFSSIDNHYGSNLSNENGVFYAGTCTAPMSIPETISHARAAATEVIRYMKNTGK
ncbi:MAG: CoB--CoM heterodisulfide reductase iron-sulfur subunit A family protein [Bacteroidetes bacterium]|nr:CoB--CoM heterodisulfide reductase iron-sulfur subunit A family protein [Bacteroidota bacterium]